MEDLEVPRCVWRVGLVGRDPGRLFLIGSLSSFFGGTVVAVLVATGAGSTATTKATKTTVSAGCDNTKLDMADQFSQSTTKTQTIHKSWRLKEKVGKLRIELVAM